MLARGFEPVASPLVETPDWESMPPAGPEVAGRETKRDATSEWIDRRRRWADARVKLLAGAAKPVARVSPSKLAGEAELREAEPGGLERERAMGFGVVVHEALEALDLKAAAAQQRRQIEQFIARSGLSDEEKRRAVGMVGAAIGSELLARARQAEQTKQLVADFEQRNDETLKSVRWMAGELDANRKRAQITRVMAMSQPAESGQLK